MIRALAFIIQVSIVPFCGFILSLFRRRRDRREPTPLFIEEPPKMELPPELHLKIVEMRYMVEHLPTPERIYILKEKLLSMRQEIEENLMLVERMKRMHVEKKIMSN